MSVGNGARRHCCRCAEVAGDSGGNDDERKRTLKKKIATKAAAATSQSMGPRNARRPRRISASITIASTAAFTPVNSAATRGVLP
jgi:hypothetical protein